MATKLNQIVAVEKGVKNTVNRDLTDYYHNIQKAPLFAGIIRTYDPKDEEGDRLPSEQTRVQLNAEDLLEKVSKSFTRLVDVTFTKDTANTRARADVVVNGTVLVQDAPVPFLLFLEKQLTDMHTIISQLPVLDPAEEWHRADGGVYATDAQGTTRTKKVPKAFTKAPATDKHPAQVEVFHEDVIVGQWNTVKQSGAVPMDRKTQLLTRVNDVKEAVKIAREEANTLDITDQHVGEDLFSFILAE